MSKIAIPLGNGYVLTAEQNADSKWSKELFVGIENETGKYIQDLAVIRPSYHYEEDEVVFNDDKFEVMVFGNEDEDDYTEIFEIGLNKDE